MHAARALNAQRKRRDEKLQAQQRRLSAVSARSASRSPVPSVDVEVGVRQKRTGSKGVDFAYVGFIIAIFGAVPLLVGCFVSVPALWEVGLGLTLLGLFIGIIFWCSDFCVQQAVKSTEQAGQRRSRSRRPLGGKVEDISSLKPVARSFKTGHSSPSARSDSLVVRSSVPDLKVETVSEVRKASSSISILGTKSSRNGTSPNTTMLLVNPNHISASSESSQYTQLTEICDPSHEDTQSNFKNANKPLKIIEIVPDCTFIPLEADKGTTTTTEVTDISSLEQIPIEESNSNSQAPLPDVQSSENCEDINSSPVDSLNNTTADEVEAGSPNADAAADNATTPETLKETENQATDESQNPIEISQLENVKDSESTSNIINIEEAIAEIVSATTDDFSEINLGHNNTSGEHKKEITENPKYNDQLLTTDQTTEDSSLPPVNAETEIPTEELKEKLTSSNNRSNTETMQEIQFSI